MTITRHHNHATSQSRDITITRHHNPRRYSAVFSRSSKPWLAVAASKCPSSTYFPLLSSRKFLAVKTLLIKLGFPTSVYTKRRCSAMSRSVVWTKVAKWRCKTVFQLQLHVFGPVPAPEVFAACRFHFSMKCSGTFSSCSTA